MSRAIDGRAALDRKRGPGRPPTHATIRKKPDLRAATINKAAPRKNACEPPDQGDHDLATAAAQTLIAAAVLIQIVARQKLPTLARVVNGWSMNTDTMGVYGRLLLKRAIIAQVGLGRTSRDAIYPINLADESGNHSMARTKYTST